MTDIELEILKRISDGQEGLAERFGRLETAFAAHCAVEEAASKRRASRVPLVVAVAACVSSAVALGTLFFR